MNNILVITLLFLSVLAPRALACPTFADVLAETARSLVSLVVDLDAQEKIKFLNDFAAKNWPYEQTVKKMINDFKQTKDKARFSLQYQRLQDIIDSKLFDDIDKSFKHRMALTAAVDEYIFEGIDYRGIEAKAKALRKKNRPPAPVAVARASAEHPLIHGATLSTDHPVNAYSYDGIGHQRSPLYRGQRSSGGHFAALTDYGDKAKYVNEMDIPINQDALSIYKTSDGRDIFLSIDGIGGHGGGEVASARIAQFIQESTMKGQSVQEAILHAPDDLKQYLKINAPHLLGEHSPGATMVAMEFIDKNSVKFHGVGDSRAVVFRNRQVLFRTKDQSAYGELMDKSVEKIKRTRFVSETQAIHEFEEGPGFNWAYKNQIDGAILAEMDEYVPKPQVNGLKLEKNDWVVMASDGLWDVLRIHEVESILHAARTPEEATQKIREKVRLRVLSGRAHADNINIIVYQH